MRKEVLVAIAVGSLVGLIIAFGVWRANKAFSFSKIKSSIETTSQEGSKEDNKPKTPTSLVVTSPENSAILSSDKVKVEGSSTPEATIVLSSENYETITETNKDGEFKTEIELAGGVNQVKVASYDLNGNKQETSLTVIYSTEFK